MSDDADERKVAVDHGCGIVVLQPAKPGTVLEHHWCRGCERHMLWGYGPKWLCERCQDAFGEAT